MKVSKIYHKYKILPNLQVHQFRVAAVGKLIAKNSKLPVEISNITTTCLLHDMGNIIKFNLDYNPQNYEPEGIDYWKKVKKEFITKYGSDEHKATILIAEEIGVSDRVLDLLHFVGFGRAKEIYQSGDINKMICAYSDHRVSPSGILPLEERVREGISRFKKNKPELDTPDNDKQVALLLDYFKKIEVKIFLASNIKPDSITDDAIRPLMDDLVMKDNLVL